MLFEKLRPFGAEYVEHRYGKPYLIEGNEWRYENRKVSINVVTLEFFYHGRQRVGGGLLRCAVHHGLAANENEEKAHIARWLKAREATGEPPKSHANDNIDAKAPRKPASGQFCKCATPCLTDVFYRYVDEYEIARYFKRRRKCMTCGKKVCHYFRKGDDGKLVWNLDGVERLPYLLPELFWSGNDTLFLFEGEKTCEAARRLHLPATSVEKWTDSVKRYLRGFEILIVPDADETGAAKAEEAFQELKGVARSRRIVRQNELVPSQFNDLADEVAAEGWSYWA